MCIEIVQILSGYTDRFCVFGPKTLKWIYTVNTQPSELKFLRGFCDELEPVKGVTSNF